MLKREPDKSILQQWAPMPRYLLRRFVVRRIMRRLNCKTFIEIGAGTGEMAAWMDRQLGMTGIALEISPRAIEMMRARLIDHPRVTIETDGFESLQETSDVLLSMEVLEHLSDDVAALRHWYRLIRPGGYIVISVPAQSRLFSEDDEMVGHFRRYDRADLVEKLAQAGFAEPRVLAYGFPLGHVLRWLRLFLVRRRIRSDRRSRQERTEASGVERRGLWLRWLLNDWAMSPFLLLQLPFLKLDWSEGYIAVARRGLDNK